MVRRRGRRSPRAAVIVAVSAVVVAAGAAAAAAAGVAAAGVGGRPGLIDPGNDDPEVEPLTASSSSWDSSPFNLESVTDNNLGLMAKSCSEKFCHAGIDGLDLWISFEEVCTLNSQPYLAAMVGGEAGQPASSSSVGATLSPGDWNPVSVGILCGFFGAASMVAGFKLGTEFHSSNRGIFH
eukprot:g17321.t1